MTTRADQLPGGAVTRPRATPPTVIVIPALNEASSIVRVVEGLRG